jgi:molecular chaperone DnaK
MTVMSYFLAVDVGTSRTAASTARFAADGSLLTAPFPLGRSSDSAPSAVFAADGEMLFGEAAERRGIAQPERLVREFKRRVGDDVPIRAGGERFAAEDLYARMVAWVVDAVAEREGTRPAAIAVTIPVAWGGHRSGLVAAALAREIPGEIRLISEPEAAARHYESTSPLGIGRTLAVYDLGGGTFDAVVLRKEAEGSVDIVGEPAGIGDFGGADFDDLVLRRVVAAAGLSTAELAADPAARVALSTLRRECVEAKEALSFDSEAVVPVLVGAAPTTVRFTRSEFEELIEGGIDRTIEALAQALETAGVEDDELEAILLTGGSSRIPRIAELLSERFDRPIAIDADPKAIVALGAARALADPDGRSVVPLAAPAVAGALVLASAADAALAVPEDTGPGAAEVDAAAFTAGAAATAKRRWFERLPATAAMATGALVLATGIVLASATGLGSSPVANTEDEPQTLADWLGITLFDSTAAMAAPETEPVAAPTPVAKAAPPPPESIRRADYSPQRTTPRATNPRTESMRKAIAASPAPSAPSSASGGGSGSSGSGSSGTGSTTPATGTNDTGSDPSPTPEETQAPAPEETQAPAPEETQNPTPTETQTPTPEETQAPAPEETQAPAPEETTPPAPEETTPPAPEQTADPTPEPAPEPPAPDPSPSPTDPV